MKRFLSLLIIFILIFTLGGCGKAKVDEENSPVIETVELFSKNSGSEDSQVVQIALFFDRNVKLNFKALDCLEVRIAGKRIRKEEFDIEVSDNAKRVNISIPTIMVTSADIEISVNDKYKAMEVFTDDSGKYSCAAFKVEGIIPCGVILQEVIGSDNEPLKNTIQVVSPFSIRSIGWLQLLDNGKPIVSNLAPDYERMGDAVALHGHEFLRDGRTQVAENIVDVITRYFGDRYTAVNDDDVIILSKNNDDSAEISLRFFTYLKLNGEDLIKKKEDRDQTKMESDRKLTEEEIKLVNAMHISQDETGAGNGKYLYDTVTITGKGLGEEQNYSVKDLESIALQSYENNFFYDMGLVVARQGNDGHSYLGIDVGNVISIGRSDDASEINSIRVISDDKDEVYNSDMFFEDEKAILAFIKDETPIMSGERNGLDLVLSDGTVICDVQKIICDDSIKPEDPHYAMHHLNGKFSSSNDLSFEVCLVKGENTVVSEFMTTKELEEYALSNPESVRKAYYGVSGIKEEFDIYGAGGWLDYFEGVKMKDIITYLIGDIPLHAKINFYNRDEKLFATIEDASYLDSNGKEEEYYVIDRSGIVIPYSEPLIAYGKNGFPLLAKHDHESPDYIPYNNFTTKLSSMGVFIEEGVVKNHNGPFVAGLGNYKELYGGNQKETGSACIKIEIVSM